MSADFGELALKQMAALVRSFGDRADEIAADALNFGAKVGRSAAVTKIHRELNLELGYIDQRVKFNKPATPSRLNAVINSRRRGTTHGTYGAQYLTQRATSPRRRLKGRKLGGIPVGRKAAGLGNYQVRRNGKRLRFPKGFIIQGRNNNIITVRRIGDGRKDFETLYGPSVSQAFGAVRDEISEVIEGAMAQRIEQSLAKLAK